MFTTVASMPDKATTTPLTLIQVVLVLLTFSSVLPVYVSELIVRSSMPDHTLMSSVSNSALTAKNELVRAL